MQVEHRVDDMPFCVRPKCGFAQLGPMIGPPCWQGCYNLIANLGSTPSAISHYLAQRCAKMGGGLRSGFIVSPKWI
jgi:hypothetical protein